MYIYIKIKARQSLKCDGHALSTSQIWSMFRSCCKTEHVVKFQSTVSVSKSYQRKAQSFIFLVGVGRRCWLCSLCLVSSWYSRWTCLTQGSVRLKTILPCDFSRMNKMLMVNSKSIGVGATFNAVYVKRVETIVSILNVKSLFQVIPVGL